MGTHRAANGGHWNIDPRLRGDDTFVCGRGDAFKSAACIAPLTALMRRRAWHAKAGAPHPAPRTPDSSNFWNSVPCFD